jgi:uncharacterized membrane protein YphA (DoxX/SURF4 family)
MDEGGLPDGRGLELSALRRLLAHDAFLLAARLVIGALFLYACVDKIAHPDRFAVAIRNYHFLPDALVNFWAITLPWAEALVGLTLVLGVWTRGAGLVSALMYFSFVIALSAALARGLDISCGCFNQGGEGSKISALYVVRDSGLLLLSLVLAVFGGGRFGVERPTPLPAKRGGVGGGVGS